MRVARWWPARALRVWIYRALRVSRRRDSALSGSVMPPEHFGAAFVARDHAGQDEQQVGEPVEVLRDFGRDRLRLGERPYPAFGTACDGACKVTGRCARPAAGKNELLQRR